MGVDDGNLSQRILAELVAGKPDIPIISRNIQSEFGVDEDDSNEIIRTVVAELNGRMFMPITKVELILVEGCNLACTYCFESQFLNPLKLKRKLMDTPMIHRALDLLFEYSRDKENLEITLFGGEPTLNMPGIRESVSYANKLAGIHEKTLKFDMTSNGVLFTEEMVKYFADNGIMVLMSIDGDKAAHDKYRVNKKGLGTFDSVLRGMDLLKKVQPWVGTKMTIMPDVSGTLFASIRYLYERGVNQFVIGHATGENWTADALSTYASQMEEAKTWYKDTVAKGGDIRISQFDEEDEQGCGGAFGCSAGRNTIAVEASGEITGCSRISTLEDHTAVGKLGSIYHGLYNLHLRQEMSGCASLYKNCSDKGIEKEYKGGCFATNYEDTSDLFQPNIREHEISLKISSANS